MSGLTYRVGADITAFESAMSRARDVAIRHSGDMLRSFQSTATGINTAFTGIQALGTLPATLGRARAAAVGLAATGAAIVGGYALVSAAISQANAQLDRFIKLGNDASKAGVGVELFQRFSEAAEKAKLDLSEVASALQNARGVVTPKLDQTDPIKDRLADIYESGYLNDRNSGVVDAYRKAGTDEERVRAAVKAMQDLLSIGERVAALDIAERLFGASFADRIRTGRIEIDAIVTALDRQRSDLITKEQVEQAREFRDRLDAAYKAIDDFFNVSVALEGSGRALQQIWLNIAEGIVAATGKLGGFVANLQEAEDKAAQGIFGKLFGEKYGELAKMLASGYGSTAYQVATGTAGVVQESLVDRARGTRTLYDKPIGPEPETAPAGNVIKDAPLPPRRPLSFYTEQREAAPARGTTTTSSLDQIETFINGLERTTAGLKGEVEAIGLSNTERQVSINLRRAEEVALQSGRSLSEAEIGRIKAASAAMAEYRDKVEDAREAQEFLRTSGGEFLTGFAQDVRSGVSAIDALSNAVGRLAARLEDKALNSLADILFGKSGGTSTGVLGSVLGSSGGIDVGFKGFFGGGFDSGGYTGAGGRYQPAGIVHRGEVVFSQNDVARHGGPAAVEALRNAPGYASGGVVGGVMPKIAMPIINLAMPAAVQRRAEGAGEVIVHNYSGQPSRETTTPGPMGPRREIVIGKAIAGAIMGDPDVAKALSQSFGLRRTGR